MPYIASSRTSTGGSTGTKPLRDEPVEHEPVQRHLEQGDVADPVGEPGPRDPGAARHVDPAAREPPGRVVARLERERRRLADPP